MTDQNDPHFVQFGSSSRRPSRLSGVVIRPTTAVDQVVWNYLGINQPQELEAWFRTLQKLLRAGSVIQVERNLDGTGFILTPPDEPNIQVATLPEANVPQ